MASVAIVGGGLGGLALAVGLQERGIEAHVFEKSDGIRADTATAISLGLNGARALDGLRPGLVDAMKSVGSQTRSIKIVDYTKGQEPVERVMDKNPVLFMIRWKRAREILRDLLPSSTVHPLHHLASYKDTGDGVDLLFDVKQEPGYQKVVRAKLVVGADGVRSAVRRLMVGDKPRDLQFINWNALVYNPDSKYFHVHEKDQVVMIRDGATFCHLVDSGEGYTMWMLRIHNMDIPGGGFATPAGKQRLLDEISKLEPPSIWEPLRTAVEATEHSLVFERRIVDNPPLKKWSDLDGRVLLIGDAAHAMHWGPGQGARTAFEDAHQLTNLLAEAFTTGNPSEIKRAVQRFEEIRIPRMTMFQSLAAEGTSLPEFTPEWVQQLPLSERIRRFQEFQAWADSYPDKMNGDPESTYFKPLNSIAPKVEARVQS